MSVRLDPAAGIAHLGTRQVPIRLRGAAGALQIDREDGPVVRPLGFMERTRLVGHAAASHTPHHALGKLIADAALVESGIGDERLVAIIAMTLAGALEHHLPAYSETVLLIAQAVGWSPEQLEQTDAVEVDRLCKLLAPTSDDGWTRLIFSQPAETDLAAIYQTLAENLLVRLQPTGLFGISHPIVAQVQQNGLDTQGAAARPRHTAEHLNDLSVSAEPSAQLSSPSCPEMPPSTVVVKTNDTDKTGAARSTHQPFFRKVTIDKVNAAPDGEPSIPSAPVLPLPLTVTRHDAVSPTYALPTHRTELPMQPGHADLTPPSTDTGQGERLSPQPRPSSPPVHAQGWAGRQIGAWTAGMAPPVGDHGPFGADSVGHPWRREPAVDTLAPIENNDARMAGNVLDRHVDISDLIDAIAARLHREADLRGIDR